MTFINISGSGATAAYASAAGGEPGGIGGGNGNFQTVSLPGIANSVLTFWTSANTITCPRTGVYAIGMKFTAVSGGGDGLRASARLLKNGSASISGLILGTTESNVTHDAGQVCGWHCLVSANAGDTFQVQMYHSWGVNATSFMCVFVPTPTNR
jgi:hypothetical protein